jgi:hypothetical protein
MAASLLPRSASSSVKYSPAIVRSAVDFRDALRPFENQAAIGLRPWPKIRATAEISQREPTARE